MKAKGQCCETLDGKRVSKKVHRLVAEAFIPNPENKKGVNHIDAVKSNNNVSNLEWATTRENIHHAYKNNLIPFRIGQLNGRAKLKESDVLEIRRLSASGVHYMEIANNYPVNRATVNKIINKKLWAHV